MRIRPARPEDAEAIAAFVVECDRTIADIAPAGTPPPFEEELEDGRDGIAMAERWISVAEVKLEVAGYVAFLAAARTRLPVDDPRLAHLGRLFVRPVHWGTGVAVRLHDAALAAASEQGFSSMRLFTPTAHARARRFYEREGWHPIATLPDSSIGLPVTEYRRDL